PSNLEITTIDIGNLAVNVVPATASLAFNIRFNDAWTLEALKSELRARLDRAAASNSLRAGKDRQVPYRLDWRPNPSPVFLTRDERLIGILSRSIKAVTGKEPALSTSGGTSDARFIKDYCPVVEFGLVGKTMHMVDEHVALADLEILTAIYQRFLEDWFR